MQYSDRESQCSFSPDENVLSKKKMLGVVGEKIPTAKQRAKM